MKAKSIVRRIDELGRIVIPKEVRTTLRIREGDFLAIFVDSEGELVLKKYSPINELGRFAKEYADSLHEAMGHIAFITDRDQIIAVSGDTKKEFLNKRIGGMVEQVMEERKAAIISHRDGHSCCTILAEEEGACGYTAKVIAPIIAWGDPIGTVIIASRKPNIMFGDLELKSALTAAYFLAKQMEY